MLPLIFVGRGESYRAAGAMCWLTARAASGGGRGLGIGITRLCYR